MGFNSAFKGLILKKEKEINNTDRCGNTCRHKFYTKEDKKVRQ
jgi:hypothetical protein